MRIYKKKIFFHFSVVEIFGGDSASGVSVLRTFRLMRIFKLIRFMKSLQKQITVMVKTLDSVMTFLALLVIFIFTVSILGMHLFGAKMILNGTPVRHNFDSLLWALMTTFQVLIVTFIFTADDNHQPILINLHSFSPM